MLTISLRAVTWRPIVLFLAGAALGATLISPVVAHVSPKADAAPSATYRRSASCAGYDFLPIEAGTSYSYLGTLRRATGFVTCDAGLPTGAVVRKVQFSLRDLSSGDLASCGLVRSGLTAATAGTYQVLAEVPGTSLAAEPGTVRQTDATINYAIIDNTRFAYWLQCRLGGDGGDLGIYGADVIYDISAANG